jgi:hypothetical protein
VQARHQQIAKLERRIAASKDRNVNPAYLGQVLGRLFLRRLLFQIGRKQ